jgi:hypothetical protein
MPHSANVSKFGISTKLTTSAIFLLQDPLTGEVDSELEREAREGYQQTLVVNQRK